METGFGLNRREPDPLRRTSARAHTPKSTAEQVLLRVRRLRELADAAVAELQSAPQPSFESVGIAYVCADEIASELDEWERDLLSESVPRAPRSGASPAPPGVTPDREAAF